MMTKSAEQQARDLLDEMEIEGAQNFSAGELVELANLIGERNQLAREVDRLRTWDGLMELLDEHWPDDIFPTTDDTDRRDPGPRIVSLIRWVDRLRAREAEVRDVCEYRMPYSAVSRQILAILDTTERP